MRLKIFDAETRLTNFGNNIGNKLHLRARSGAFVDDRYSSRFSSWSPPPPLPSLSFSLSIYLSIYFPPYYFIPYYFLTITIEIYSWPVRSKFGRLVTGANRITLHPFDRSRGHFKIQPALFFPPPTALSFYVTSLDFRRRTVELSVGTCSALLNLNTDRVHSVCVCAKITHRRNLRWF